MILDGWKAILAHLEAISGGTFARVTIWRWSRKKTDPLPAYKRLGHLQADACAITAWWARNGTTYMNET